MTKRDWAVLACKTVALWALFKTAYWVIRLLGSVAEVVSEGLADRYLDWEAIRRSVGMLLGSAFPAAIMALLVALLWRKANRIAAWIFPETDEAESTLAPHAGPLLTVAVMVTGLVVIATELPDLISLAFWIMFTAEHPMTAGREWRLLSPGLRIAFGLYLVVGHRSVVKLLTRFRGLGLASEGSETSEVESKG